MIYDFFSDVSKKVGFPFIINNNNEFYTFQNGTYKKTILPDFLMETINSEKLVNLFWEKEEKIAVVKINITLDNINYHLILKDTLELKNVSTIFNTLFDSLYEAKFELSHISREIEMLREEFTECERELGENQKRLMELEEQLGKKNTELDGYTESVDVLRKSRTKMLKLIDGIDVPLFSTDKNYELVNVNRATGRFTNEENLPHFIGSKCFKLIFGHDDICPWCRYDEIVYSKNSVCQHININKKDKNYVYEHVMFPILDISGEVVEVGETITDITESYGLIENLKKTKKQFLEISKDKIKNINEINTLRKEFEILNDAYEASQNNVKKLSLTIQKIIEQSSAKEFLSLKNENIQFKRELQKYSEIVSNYRDNQKKFETEMLGAARKSAYSIDRLINIIDKRKNIDDEELKKIFDILKTGIEEIKNKLGKEDSDDHKSGN